MFHKHTPRLFTKTILSIFFLSSFFLAENSLIHVLHTLPPTHTDVIGRVGVYTLDGFEGHSNLLEFVLDKDTVQETAAVIVLDMSRPW